SKSKNLETPKNTQSEIAIQTKIESQKERSLYPSVPKTYIDTSDDEVLNTISKLRKQRSPVSNISTFNSQQFLNTQTIPTNRSFDSVVNRKLKFDSSVNKIVN